MVLGGVIFSRLFRMVYSVQVVTVRDVGMVFSVLSAISLSYSLVS
jgi:hypothetical protein